MKVEIETHDGKKFYHESELWNEETIKYVAKNDCRDDDGDILCDICPLSIQHNKTWETCTDYLNDSYKIKSIREYKELKLENLVSDPVKEEKPFEFMEGDIVNCVFFGDEKFILKIDEENVNLFLPPLYFERDGLRYTFSRDGKYLKGCTVPTIKLVERPKKKVKKTYHFASWLLGNTGRRISSDLFLSKEDFSDHWKSEKDYQENSIEIEVEE